MLLQDTPGGHSGEPLEGTPSETLEDPLENILWGQPGVTLTGWSLKEVFRRCPPKLFSEDFLHRCLQVIFSRRLECIQIIFKSNFQGVLWYPPGCHLGCSQKCPPWSGVLQGVVQGCPQVHLKWCAPKKLLYFIYLLKTLFPPQLILLLN
jgi:hypothetical protein